MFKDITLYLFKIIPFYFWFNKLKYILYLGQQEIVNAVFAIL